MNNVLVRSRYPRHSIPAKRRKRIAAERSNLQQIIIRQLVVSILILLVVSITKSINTPATNYTSEKIQYTLKQNMEINSIYEYIGNAIGKLKGSTTVKNDNIKDEYNTTSLETSVLAAGTDEGTTKKRGMIIPVKGFLSSHYGNRTDSITNSLKFHEGIDIDAEKGGSIVAALGGTVIEAGSSPSYGNYIRVRHEGGLETLYAHCSELRVIQGREVKQGDVIAKVGDIGAAVGVHLHFEVWKDGKSQDPLNYISVPEQ